MPKEIRPGEEATAKAEKPETIRSLQNPLVKEIVRLRQASHRRRTGLFWIEGRREVERAVAADWPIRKGIYCSELSIDPLPFGSHLDAVDVALPVFQKLSRREGPDGIGALAESRQENLDTFQPDTRASLIPQIEAIEKPGNLGALVRTADAAGVDAIWLIHGPEQTPAEPFAPEAIRASQGAIFRLPILTVARSQAIDWLQHRKIPLLAARPDADALLWDVDLRQPVAVALGTEHEGLSPELSSAAKVAFRLPMAGVSDSLNVAAAGAVTLFEAVRQRQSG